MKILFLTNLLSPYRVEWLNLLAEHNSLDAYYLSASEKTRTEEWLSSRKPVFQTFAVESDKAFFDTLKKQDYDIYIIDGYSSSIKLKALKMLKSRGKSIFINIDGVDIWRPRSKTDWIKDKIKQRVFRSGATFLCGSHIAAQTVINGGCPEDRVFVHPFTSLHTQDIIEAGNKPTLQQQCKKQLQKEDKKIALAVGRFIPLKQYDRLIQAWKDMPDDCYLYIIGGGEERACYEELIQRLNVRNIELIDFLLPEKLIEYFRAADLFVHPSSTETWGLVLNEAMANGCPCIATDHCVGGVELIEEGKEGFLIKVGDVEDLHDKMVRILTDDPLRAAMAENAVKKIQPYTYENMAALHLKIFQDTMR